MIIELWVAVWGTHRQTVPRPVSLQRKLHESLTERASVLSLQIPLCLTSTSLYIHAGSIVLRLPLLRVQELGVGFGFLVSRQFLLVEMVQVAHGALRVQAVSLVLLTLRLLPCWHLDVLSVLLSEALQRGAGTAGAAAAAASTQCLLLDG